MFYRDAADGQYPRNFRAGPSATSRATKLDHCQRLSLLVLLGLSVLLVGGPRPSTAATGNILFVLADDIGIDMTPFYPLNVRFQTTPPPSAMPNVTALAQRGVMFKRFWVTPWCSPTRASLLTGRYGFRHGIGRPKTSGLPQLALEEVTLPEVIASVRPEYVLAHIGKWHVSNEYADPNLQGWPYYAGPDPRIGQLPSFFTWTKVVNGVGEPSTTYATIDQANEAVSVIRQAREQDRPFFVWLAFTAPHAPFRKPPNELHSHDDLPDHDAPNRDIYEAMVEAMDTEIGRVLAEVDLATTTVIFLGDNGSPMGDVVRAPYDEKKSKGTVYEPGVQVPLVVAGARVRGRGRIVLNLTAGVDLFSTILDLAGVDPAAPILAGVKTDSVTLLPYLEARPHPAPRKFLYAEAFTLQFDGDWQRTARNGNYALIERYDGTREFYDLKVDPLENTNLLTRTLTTTEKGNLKGLKRQMDTLLATR